MAWTRLIPFRACMLERGAAPRSRHAWFAPRMMAAPWWLLLGARKCVPGPWCDSSVAPCAVMFGPLHLEHA